MMTPRLRDESTSSWPNVGCALWRAVCRSRSCIHSEADTCSSCSAMTQYYPTTSAAAVGERAIFPCSAMLLIYPYSLLPAGALGKTLLFILCLLQTRDKERCGSSKWLSNLQPCHDNFVRRGPFQGPFPSALPFPAWPQPRYCIALWRL